MQTPFEIIGSYVDPKCVRNYGTVVMANGNHIAATDGFGLVAVPSVKPIGTYRLSGEPSEIKPPQFGPILEEAKKEASREVTSSEKLFEAILALPKKSKLFVGISREDDSMVVITPQVTPTLGKRVWFSATNIKRWMPMTADASFRVSDDKFIATNGEFTHLIVSVAIPKN